MRQWQRCEWREPKMSADMSGNRFRDYMAARLQPPIQVVEQALAFSAEFEVPVFPCTQDKKPLPGTHGFKDASRDPDTIRAMFGRAGAALIGMPTGEASGFTVLDVDVKDGAQGETWLIANAHRLPATLTSRTRSGGSHWWYRYVPGLRNSASKIAQGVDIRGCGGYIVAPPSAGYTWAKRLDVATMPAWIVEALAVSPEPVARPSAPHRPVEYGGTAYGLAALDDECRAIRNAVTGQKHHAVNKAAFSIGGLVAAGELEEGPAFAALRDALAAILPACRDPRAAERTLANSFRDGMGRPRDVPEPTVQAVGMTDEERADIAERCGPLLAKLAKQHAEAAREQAKAQAAPLPVSADIMRPGGVLQMLMDECQRTAIRAQPFLWLGAAVCAVGTLAGRRYETPSGLRTNVYVAAVAESGSGKDHAPSVVRRAFNSAGVERYLGGEDLASGSGLLQSLAAHPARLFILDELGMFLRTVTSKNAPVHKAEIWSEFIKIYSRAKEKYNGKEYANKDGKNERVDIWYPHPVVYGMTTPSTFWAALEGGSMLDGGLARFLLFLSDQDLPPRNKKPGNPETPEGLVSAIQAIAHGPGSAIAPGNLPSTHYVPMSAKVQEAVHRVPMTGEADGIHDRHMDDDQDAWAIRKKGTSEVPIISRLGENALKLALIRAVSTNPAEPVIGAVEIKWGWQLALHCTRSMLKEAGRFIADSEYERKLNKAMEIIQRHGPITEYEMLRKGFKSLGKESERRELLHTLASAGLIAAIQQPGCPGGGRPTTRYHACGNLDSDVSALEKT